MENSEWKLQNALALQDSITVTCQNTTGYDKAIVDDYICTPACDIPETIDGMQHDWAEIDIRPELNEVLTYWCTDHQIVPMGNFTHADPGAPLDKEQITCTMSGKYDKSKLLTETNKAGHKKLTI